MKTAGERGADHGHQPRDRDWRGPGRSAVAGTGAAAGLDERQQQASTAARQQHDPDRVEVEAPPTETRWGAGSQRRASTTATTAIGRLTKKIQRQPASATEHA